MQVHQQMPDELLAEATRGLAVSQKLIDGMMEQLPDMPCMGSRR